MGKHIKIWLITALCLIATGCVLFGGVMTAVGWNFFELSAVEFETNTYVISQDYRNIRITTKDADVVLAPSENGETTVVCREHTRLKHTAVVAEDTLVIGVEDNRQWYDHIGINFETQEITIYLPKDTYRELCAENRTGFVLIPADFRFESLAVSTSTGDIVNFASADSVHLKASTGGVRTENITTGELTLSVSTGMVSVTNVICEDLDITVSTGRTELDGITCKSLSSSGNTGDVELKKVVVEETLSVKRSTGDIRLEDCDAGAIFMETDTGDVFGILRTPKTFIAKSNTGSVQIPQSATGGKCEVITTTGDIKIEIGA